MNLIPVRTHIITISLITALLGGCKVDTNVDLYSVDIKEIDGTENFDTPSKIKIQVTGCDDNKSEIMNIAQKYFEINSAATCSNSDGEEFVEFSAKTPLVYNQEFLPKNITFGIFISETEDGSRAVWGMLDLSRFSAMENDVKKLDITASLELNSITINLNNDGRETITVNVPAAFINNIAEINTELSLTRRENATLRLSDVGVSQVANNGKSLIFLMK